MLFLLLVNIFNDRKCRNASLDMNLEIKKKTKQNKIKGKNNILTYADAFDY